MSAKLVLRFEDRGCHVVSVTDPCGRILNFLDRGRTNLVQNNVPNNSFNVVCVFVNVITFY
jgi:hypothetical protein